MPEAGLLELAKKAAKDHAWAEVRDHLVEELKGAQTCDFDLFVLLGEAYMRCGNFSDGASAMKTACLQQRYTRGLFCGAVMADGLGRAISAKTKYEDAKDDPHYEKEMSLFEREIRGELQRDACDPCNHIM